MSRMSGSRDPIIIYGNSIYTRSEVSSRVEALAFRDEKIILAGARRDMKRLFPNAEYIHLNGCALLPSFADSHVHFRAFPDFIKAVPLDECRNAGEVQDILLHHLHSLGSGHELSGAIRWVVGTDFFDDEWVEQLSGRHLDALSCSIPVLVLRLDGHDAVANKKAIECLPDSCLDPRMVDVGRGVIREGALEYLLEDFSAMTDVEAYYQSVRSNLLALARLGVTSIDLVLDGEAGELRALERLRSSGLLSQRVSVMPHVKQLPDYKKTGVHTGFGDEWLRIGAMKFFVDGDIASQTAALREDYFNKPGYKGILRYDNNVEFKGAVCEAAEAGFQIAIHAIGDAAIEHSLDALEAIAERYPGPGPGGERRDRIEHFELGTDEQIRRATGLGIIFSMQPALLARQRVYRANVGSKWASANNRIGDIVRAGGCVICGSDMPPYCRLSSPLFGIRQLMDTENASQHLNASEAIECYTRRPAWVNMRDSRCGRLEPGCFADMVILSRDIFSDRDMDISDRDVERTRVLCTIAGGSLIYFDRDAGKWAPDLAKLKPLVHAGYEENVP